MFAGATCGWGFVFCRTPSTSGAIDIKCKACGWGSVQVGVCVLSHTAAWPSTSAAIDIIGHRHQRYGICGSVQVGVCVLSHTAAWPLRLTSVAIDITGHRHHWPSTSKVRHLGQGVCVLSHKTAQSTGFPFCISHFCSKLISFVRRVACVV